MSYLDVPRLHFLGRYYVDPPTINNIRQNYAPGDTDPTPFWSPHGSGDFRFSECKIVSVFDAAGKHLAFDHEDQLINGPLGCREDRGAAKLVDLDTDQQNVSTVYGMRLQLSLRQTAQSVIGDVEPVSANGLWPNVIQTFGFGQVTMTLAAASFQTVVRVAKPDWPDTPESPVLQALRSACEVVNGHHILSLKFMLDAFITDRASAQFGTGRVVGTLGAWKQGEPHQCPNRRWMSPPLKAGTESPPADWKSAWPPWNFTAFNGAPFCVDEKRKRLTIDLANSRQFISPGGPAANVGRLQAVIAGGESEVIIGTVDYSEFRHRHAAGIAELPLTDEQVTLLASRPLHLVAHQTALDRGAVLTEDAAGLDYAVDQRVFRLAHDTPEIAVLSSTAYVTRFGRPAEGVKLSAELRPSATHGVPEGNNCLEVEATASDESGQAVIVVRATRNPGHPIDRPGGLDGQIFKFELLTGPRQTAVVRQERELSIHLYEDCPVPKTPEWKDVLAIFLPYKPLYPNMFERVDMTNPEAFGAFAKLIAERLQLPFDHPKYMPVTRDMSPHKTQLILNYIHHHTASPVRVLAPLPLAAAQLPYQLHFEEKQYTALPVPLPALQSFCVGRIPDSPQWLLVSGQTKGIHGFAQGGDANTILYVIEPDSGRSSQFDLAQLGRPSITEPLSVTNAQSYYDPDSGYYYQLGGYGFDGDSGNFITFDVLTRFKLREMIDAITESPQQHAKILGLIEQTRDPRLAVTGGALLPLGSHMLLVFGQRFTGALAQPMPPTTTAAYTEQVRCFRFRDGAVPGIAEPTYGATPDRRNHEFHRRDLNVVPAINPESGLEHVTALGGVFRFGLIEAFDNPVLIEHNGTTFTDHEFTQRMNLYQCPVIGVYDAANKLMSHSLFGGITNWVPSGDYQFLAKEPLSMSNQVSMLTHGADGAFHEYLHPDGIPGRLKLGTDAVFLLHPDLEKNKQVYPNGLLKLDQFALGSRTLVGYIYGGVESFEDSVKKTESRASSRVFSVFLTASPGRGFQIS